MVNLCRLQEFGVVSDTVTRRGQTIVCAEVYWPVDSAHRLFSLTGGMRQMSQLATASDDPHVVLLLKERKIPHVDNHRHANIELIQTYLLNFV